MKNSIKDNETALLICGPLDRYGFDFPHSNMMGVLKRLLEKNGTNYSIGDFETYASYSSEICETPIDSLLPSFCCFAKVPKEYGESIVERCAFSLKQIKNVDEEFKRDVKNFSPILIFRDFPNIFNSLLSRADSYSSKRNIMEFLTEDNIERELNAGLFLIDIDDEIIKLLIEYSDRVLKEETLANISKIIIRSKVIIHEFGYYDITIFAEGLLSNIFLLKQILSENK